MYAHFSGTYNKKTQASGPKQIITADGRVIDCQGETYFTLSMAGKTIKVLYVAIQKMLPGVDVVIGTDVLKLQILSRLWKNFYCGRCGLK